MALIAGGVALGVTGSMGHVAGRSESPQLVAFHTEANGTVSAIITNPLAAKSQLGRVFRQHGLDISITVVPVSPSLVGSIVYSDVAVRPVHSGTCLGGGGATCTVGLDIPAGFHGPGTVAIGRAARPGETYVSSASAFGPGELLHCTNLLDTAATMAAPALQARAHQVIWVEQSRRAGATNVDRPVPTHTRSVPKPPANYYLANVLPISSTTIKAIISPQPTADHALTTAARRGC